MRGEYAVSARKKEKGLGSPPLARGIPEYTISFADRMRITPACAGNTDTGSVLAIPRRDHPRLRGEYFNGPHVLNSSTGSPPLARGIPPDIIRRDPILGITPACAGNTLKKSHIYSLFPISTSKFHLVSQTPEMS